MRAILLLGANFARTQWIAIAVMTGYLIGAGGLFAWHQQPTDVQFYVQWHTYYVLAASALIAIPAIWSERRSRRILAVLSKGIGRWQYLGGLLFGCVMISAWFCLLMGSISAWMCSRGSIPAAHLPALMVALFLCSVMAEAVALFWAALLHPLLATIATAAFLLAPLSLGPVGWDRSAQIFPVALLVSIMREFHFQVQGPAIWGIAAAAFVETFLFWGLASVVFSRKDVTISPE